MTNAAGGSRAHSTIDPCLRAAIRHAFGESVQAPGVVRDFGLVACGAKPAAVHAFRLFDDGVMRYGGLRSWWNPEPLLEALRRAGLAVVEFPNLDGPGQITVVVAPTVARAHRVAAAKPVSVDARPESLRRADQLNLRMGVLLGYPRSGSLALVGQRPEGNQADLLPHLSAVETWFANWMAAGDEAGLREAIDVSRRHAAAFEAAFGPLHGHERKAPRPFTWRGKTIRRHPPVRDFDLSGTRPG